MTNLLKRGIRKYRSSGLRNTLNAGWESLYSDTVLNKLSGRYIYPRIDPINRVDILRNHVSNDFIEYPEKEITDPIPRRINIPNEADVDSVPYYRSHPSFIWSCENARIFPPAGLGITSDGRPIVELVGPPREFDDRLVTAIAKSMAHNGIWSTYRELGAPSTSIIEPDIDRACVLMPPFNNYYHWTIECLLRIRLLKQSNINLDTVTFVLSEDSSWMKESLSLLGISPENYIVCKNKIVAKELVIPSFPDPPSYTDLNWLRQEMTETITQTKNDRRIHISRSDATRRRLQNEDELLAVLDEFEFESHVLSNLTVREQIRLFSEAEMIVGAHGAGFTNIIYGSDLSVIELFGDEKRTTFFQLSHILNHNYDCVAGETVNIDIKVDTDDVRQTVARNL